MSEVCAHVPCSCPVEPGQIYCSPHCANVGAEMPERGEERCECGHPACSAGDSRAIPLRE